MGRVKMRVTMTIRQWWKAGAGLWVAAEPRGLLSEEENAWLEVKGACHPSDCSIQLHILVTLFCIVLSYKNI